MNINKDKLIDVLKKAHLASSNTVNRDILAGAVERLTVKNALTPKQALWCIKYMTDHDIPLTVDIIAVTEKEATLPEQKSALASVKAICEDIEIVDGASEPSAQLFDWGVIVDIEKATESLLAKIKSIKKPRV